MTPLPPRLSSHLSIRPSSTYACLLLSRRCCSSFLSSSSISHHHLIRAEGPHCLFLIIFWTKSRLIVVYTTHTYKYIHTSLGVAYIHTYILDCTSIFVTCTHRLQAHHLLLRLLGRARPFFCFPITYFRRRCCFTYIFSCFFWVAVTLCMYRPFACCYISLTNRMWLLYVFLSLTEGSGLQIRC